MSTIAHPITTAEQLLQAPCLDRCELVRGKLIMMTPAGFEHGCVVVNISTPLAVHVRRHGLGLVTGAETGFQIGRNPDTVRAPDVGLVRAERVPATPMPGFFDGPPDLAVEVLSPGDRASDVLVKVRDWLAAGCRAVWVADPATRTVSVYREPGRATVLSAGDELTGDDVVKDFRLPVADIFPS